MDSIKKWLLSLDASGDLDIQRMDVNRHVPVNRLLDTIGFFQLNFCDCEGRRYLLVTKPEEETMLKSKILVTRIVKEGNADRMVDMPEDALGDMEIIADKFMRKVTYIQ